VHRITDSDLVPDAAPPSLPDLRVGDRGHGYRPRSFESDLRCLSASRSRPSTMPPSQLATKTTKVVISGAVIDIYNRDTDGCDWSVPDIPLFFATSSISLRYSVVFYLGSRPNSVLSLIGFLSWSVF